jgi:hypothetical protein
MIRCGECKWFAIPSQAIQSGQSLYGYCHAVPPKANTPSGLAVWVSVLTTDFCGMATRRAADKGKGTIEKGTVK